MTRVSLLGRIAGVNASGIAAEGGLLYAAEWLTESGIEALRRRYRERFDHAPALQATIKRRIVLDRFVVDWEHVNGVPEGAFDAIATYEVVGGRIANVWFLRP